MSRTKYRLIPRIFYYMYKKNALVCDRTLTPSHKKNKNKMALTVITSYYARYAAMYYIRLPNIILSFAASTYYIILKVVTAHSDYVIFVFFSTNPGT